MANDSIKNLCENGTIIKFQTINPLDIQNYSGKVMGIVSYDIAKLYSDPLAYQQEVLTDISNTGLADASVLDYVVVQMQDSKVRAFAIEWIKPGTFEVISIGTTSTLKIYNISTEQQVQLVELLRSNGYVISLN